jgi:hypothetical protein
MNCVLCFHVGLPKTGTTYLQDEIFPNISGIKYLGKLRGDYNTQATDQFFSELFNDTDSYSSLAQRTLFKSEILPDLDAGRPNVISQEAFSRGIVDRGVLLQRIVEAHGQVRILFTIRRQQDLLQSMYSDFLKRATTDKAPYLNFDLWLELQWDHLLRPRLEESALARLQFHELISLYVKQLGEENVGVLVYEEIREDPASFASRLGGFLGTSPAELETLLKREVTTNHNTRATRSQRLALFVTNRLKMNSSIGSLLPKHAKSALKMLLDRGDATTIRVSESQLEKIADLCRAGNDALAAERKLPLEKYGYML